MMTPRHKPLSVATLAALIALAVTYHRLDAQITAGQRDELRQPNAPAGAMWLDSLDLTRMVQRRGTARAGAYRGGSGNAAPKPLTLAGVVYPHGIGTLSINELIVDAWGAGSSGQIGDGGTAQRNAPVVVNGPASVSTLALGNAHSMAVTPAGEIWTWGEVDFGRLGDASTQDRVAPGIQLPYAVTANECVLPAATDTTFVSGVTSLGVEASKVDPPPTCPSLFSLHASASAL